MLLTIAFILFFALIAAMLVAPSTVEAKVPSAAPELKPVGTRVMVAD